MASNPHHRRLPRDARHLISRIRALGRTGYARAAVLHAQVAALDYAVSRRENRARPLPADTDLKAPGERVRLGTEVRDLLARLHKSQNLREQQALVREIRHAVMRRIVIHARRAIRLQAARRRIAGGASRARALTAAGWERAREARKGPEVRVVGSRRPAERTRAAAPARASRSLPEGERAARPSRTRAPRERAGL